MKKTKLKAKRLGKTSQVAKHGINPRSVGMDYFQNMAARMGYGTPSLAEDTQYEMVRLSNSYQLMLTLYRNHWIARRIVDLPAQDMTRAWCKLTSQIPPDDIQQFDRIIQSTFTPARIRQALKWARLYGGAGCLICIKGHEKYLNEPLDLDDVNPGSYLGLIPFDRWLGIQPSMEISNDLARPLDWGLPTHYKVSSDNSGESYPIHSSRILRFTGPMVPNPEFQAQVYWGISIIEVVYEELRKRDNASWAMLQILFRANILAQKNPELASMLSGLGMSAQALQNFNVRMQAQNELLSNQSMLILGEDGELQSTQFSFGGLAEVYSQFQMDVAGAAEMTVTRLFGRTISGLGQQNEGDERQYEETIAQKQDDELRPQLDKLYPVICMSVLGEVPDDLDVRFPSVRVLTEEQKADMADKGSAPVIAAYNAGVISQQTTLKELRELSDVTGIFTNITDEDIDKAETEVMLPGEGMGEGGEAGQGGQGGSPASHAKPNPSKQLKQEAGGALDEDFEAQLQELRDATFRGRLTDRAIPKRLKWHGLDVSIEHQAGDKRSGEDSAGNSWEVTMSHDYGYLLGTKGVDGDQLDVFMGPDQRSEQVFVVHTLKAPDFEEYDEDKCFLDFTSEAKAKEAFFANYDRPGHFGSIDAYPLGAFIDRALGTKKKSGIFSRIADAVRSVTDPFSTHVGEQ